MRRKEKSLSDRSAMDRIIQGAEFCHLSCCLYNSPYLIPVSFGYDGEAIYIHTAMAGKKIEFFESNPRVCLSFVSRAELITDPGRAFKWSFQFSSVIAEGEISELTDPEQKISALNQIMAHYSGRDWEIPVESLSGTRTWKITLQKITAKATPTNNSLHS